MKDYPAKKQNRKAKKIRKRLMDFYKNQPPIENVKQVKSIKELIEQEAEKLNNKIIESDKQTAKDFAEKIIQYSTEPTPSISNS